MMANKIIHSFLEPINAATTECLKVIFNYIYRLTDFTLLTTDNGHHHTVHNGMMGTADTVCM